MYIQQDEFSTEVQVYDNFGQPYNDGVFLVEIPIPSPAQFVTLRRPLGSIMVICEVEVYAGNISFMREINNKNHS